MALINLYLEYFLEASKLNKFLKTKSWGTTQRFSTNLAGAENAFLTLLKHKFS